jgi:hypothetical protein
MNKIVANANMRTFPIPNDTDTSPAAPELATATDPLAPPGGMVLVGPTVILAVVV